MSDPFIGEIKMFAGNYAPYGYAQCMGQVMAVSQNQALAAIVGPTYGGDGRTTFGLPNLGGVTPIGQGQAPGCDAYSWAESGGKETVQLMSTNMPAHTHPVQGTQAVGVTNIPSPTAFLAAAEDAAGTPANIYGSANDPKTPINTSLYPQAVSVVGGSSPISLRNPYMTISFIIALTGEFPIKP
ncbi:phage tail protein [Pseudomonas sp. S60]|uniref:phage tail protein n=1 Tax=unclassified Pseudomonas TaxID=196821 RepID=UPI0019143175|nr:MULTISPECIES: tail fiber protein [unclassified Pseudomonas]MBK5007315.1 phage tail protein [Pseudomonas sp. S32]MBK5009824.1 phage tail protein [Pseudomonas sp. S60]